MTIILGNTGMLGSMLANTWEGEFISTDRNTFDARFNEIPRGDMFVNCIGVIKPYCNNIKMAIEVNALFPHYLSTSTLQIATDCVFSGKEGSYNEESLHDATDVYGKTKSLGEAPHIKNLRCSIIGPEVKNHISLYDQVLAGKVKDGYTNHLWNGITTYAFAKICQGIIREKIDLPTVQHIVPKNIVSKFELVNLINPNTMINPIEAPEAIDRTLTTLNPELNKQIWQAAGYKNVPTIEYLVKELANL